MHKTIVALSLIAFSLVFADGPEQWALDHSRNTAMQAKNLPHELSAGNRLWEYKLGRFQYAIPVVHGDYLLLGGDQRALQDKVLQKANTKHHSSGAVVCINRHTGQLVWEVLTKGVTSEKTWWWGNYGVCASPVPEEDRVYVLGSGGDVLCLDMKGMANGNDGLFQDELTYFANEGEPLTELKSSYGDILWRYDAAREHGVCLHDAVAGTPLLIGDYLWLPTSQAIGRKGLHRDHPSKVKFDTEGRKGHGQHPSVLMGKDGVVQVKYEKAPPAPVPNVIVLNKNTGELVAYDDALVPYIFHGQWSSLSSGTVNGRRLIFYGDGYGVLHAYEEPDWANADGAQVLKEAWSFDCSRPYRYIGEEENLYLVKGFKRGDNPTLDDLTRAPNEIIGTPVFHGGRVYVAIGRDHNYGDGRGLLWCIDPTGAGDISETGVVWSSDQIITTMSSIAIQDGLLFIQDPKHLRCFDIKDGAHLWSHDFGRHQRFYSPIVADGKVYACDGSRYWVLAASREKKLLAENKLNPGNDAIAPTAVNGVLYAVSGKWIQAYELQNKKEEVTSEQ